MTRKADVELIHADEPPLEVREELAKLVAETVVRKANRWLILREAVREYGVSLDEIMRAVEQGKIETQRIRNYSRIHGPYTTLLSAEGMDALFGGRHGDNV